MSLLLTVSIVITTIVPSTAVSAAESSSTEVNISTQNDDNTPQTKIRSDDAETSSDQTEKTDDAKETSKASLEQSQSQQADKTKQASTKAATDTNLYQNGSICIYNEQQLKAVGTGTQVYEGDASADTFGTGAVLTDEEGNTLTYAADGSYTLMNDIPLTKESIWTLPEGFAGSFQGAEITAEKPLYDAETDTIYVYNNYQLATINDPDAIKTVMSNDMIASEFGVGQVVYTDEEKKTQLEYTADHNYVLSKDFTEQMPEMKATQVQAEVTDEQLDGRSYIGQVIFNETDAEGNTKQYILIGNKQQLEAIGKTDKDGNPIKVTEPVWAQNQQFKGVSLGLGTWKDVGSPYLYYNGDADLQVGELLYDDPDANNPGVGKNTVDVGMYLDQERQQHFGSKKNMSEDENTYTYDENAKKHVNMERLPGDDSDPAYTTWANYIIFRDIDLKNNERNPIMFSGTMEGRKDMESGQGITISNINVIPATKGDKLDTSKNIGIGFFGTITNQPDANNFGISGGTASVKNITLSQISVSNTMTEAAEGETLISGLLGVVGGLLGAVGGILDGLLGWIGDLIGSALGNKDIFDGVSLEKLLTNLLDVRKTAPDTFATGGFAGRIIGDVEVTGCHVEGLTISNVKDMTGGFVGNVEGLTEYDGLSKTLEGTVDVLTGILNVIPGLGLGDLITVLIGTDGNGLVQLDQLIPTRYIQAQIKKCSVNVNSIENNNGKYVGGFAGMQTGSSISDCTVSNLQKVTATKYAGGFTGVTRDAIVKGLLESLDADLVPHLDKLNPSSNIVGCKVEGTELIVQSTGKYAGGFTGMAGNSSLSNSSVSGLTSVTAIDNYSGGFAGRATLGSGIIMAGKEEGDIQETGLLGTVTDLLKTVLAGDCDTQLLNLVGISATEMEGCSVSGTNFEVEAAQYAGGLIGQGDGVIIRAFVSNNSETESTSTANNIDGIGAVSATNYAGGVAGQMLPANGSGVLDGVLSIANVLPFSLENINVIAGENGFAITTDEEYAGGAIGQATGGTIEQVTLTNIKQVTAKNYSGGFVGYAGPGSILESGGLNILGLVKINSLLQVGEMLETQIKTCKVQGKDLQVSATGNVPGKSYFAGGFIGENSSSKIQDSSVTELKKVSTELKTIEFGNEENMTASYAGGFAARSQVGGLADVGDSDTVDGLLGGEGVVSIDGLLDAVGYLIPEYTNCYVKFTDSDGTEAQVNSAISGGFIGEMQGGIIDNTTLGDKYAVRNVKYIEGTYYAGGFAGKVLSGGLAQSNGLSLLGTDIDVAGLLSLIPTYIPKIKTAGVQSGNNGLKVYATSSIDTDVDSGTAGGYVGLARGANISNSDVSELATKTSEEEPGTNDYAVQALVYAGGYVGKADIGSAAAVGNSLSVLGIAEIGDLTSAIAAVESKFESCNVYGKTGGFNVKSSEGNAGGYAGIIEGSNFNDSNSYNFEYIEGVVSAGGYAGTIQPGDVAKLVGTADVLNGLVSVDNLLGVAKTFIPRIWNSETTAVPCGGYIKATGESSDATKRGLAGGYVGYNLGGQIQGNKEEIIIEGNTPKMRTASAIRIRSVYGTEYAGGYTGLMESANIADTGSFKLLYGLIKLKTPLTALQAVYATEENTAVYGPLTYVDVNDWNRWVTYVGSKGPYADEFAGKTFGEQKELDEFLKDYIYGYEVVSPGADSDKDGMKSNGYAGGYAGKITGAHVTNGQANDLKEVTAWNSAGGFVGVMTPASLASLGDVDIAGLNIVQGLDVLQTFVSVIEKSGVTGYKSGATVQATGYKEGENAGYAGGFAGNVIGGQIWGETTGEGDSQVSNPCTVKNVCKVTAKNAVGGFAGQILPGSAASVDTSSSNALLNGLLNSVIGTSGDLASVLETTIATIRNVQVTTDNGMGIVVQGAYDNNGTTAYAQSAGGFAGSISGAIVGQKDHTENGIHISNLQVVNGGEYAGGFAGKADVSAAVEISGQNDTTILDLLAKLGGVDVLDILRPYIYNVDVNGIENYGLEVVANIGKKLTDKNEEAGLYTGNAGGFIGALLCGTVEDSNVTALRSVQGLNYSGGFIGHMGKSGLVDADGVDVLDKLLGLGVGVADVIGSNANRCTVTGVDSGFTVKSSGGESEIAGGFVGYGDLGRMESDTVNKLKQVSSDKIAGGFVGKTSYAYLADVKVDGELIDLVSKLLNALLKELLQLDEAQAGNVVELDLGIIKVNALWDGKLLSVNLLGIPITASLVEEENQLEVTIGDSSIKLGYETGNDPTVNVGEDELESTLEVNLIKANRTKVSESSVTGIDIGYDVFGGGATNDKDGNGDQGYAGGFAGFNNEGLLENNKMIKADTIRGTSGKVGEFDGGVSLQSVWTELKDIEKGNTYQVYRLWDDDQLAVICNTNGNVLATAQDEAENINGIDYYLYTVNHMSTEYLVDHEDWNSAYQSAYQTPKAGSAAQFPVNVYVSAAQADLMLGTPTEENVSDPDKIGQITQDACDTNVTLTIQKLWMDNNNKGNTRPEHVDVQIIKDEGVYKDIDMKSNPSDSNKDSWIWTDTVEIGVLNSTNTGYDHVYQYTVTETPIDGYVTIYGQSEDGYTLYIINYLMSEFIQGDSIVIDYGLPVYVDVLANDRVTENGANGQLVAVGTGTTATTISKELNTGLSNGVTGSYGTAQIQEQDGKKIIEYQPSSMKMDSFDQFTYAVQLNQDVVKNDQNYVYGSLNVIPATEIYYEDNFNMIKYENGTDGTGGDHGTWKTVGTEDSGRHQDTDRPGMAELKNAIDSIYGNDTHYVNDSTYSGGSSHVVTISKNNLASSNGTAPKATFKFIGTGFDLISVTSGDSGAVRVVVRDENGKQVKAKTVNTYYGYNYSETEGWKVDKEATGALYQIPIIKIEGLTQGTYEVEIIPTYSSAFDKTGDGQYKFYLDAIRIYDPVDIANPENEIIKEAYQADGELNSRFIELRDLLLNAGKVTEDSSVAEGIVFIDGNSNSVTLSDYESFGPKNEVYLMHDQAISFYIETDKIPESIQLSAKLAMGDSAKLKITCAVEEENGWKEYRSDMAEINTAYDMHYDISNQCIWEGNDEIGYRTKYPIVISNASESSSDSTSTGAVISLTNLNWTGAIMPFPALTDENSDINLKISTDKNAVMAAHNLISVK